MGAHDVITVFLGEHDTTTTADIQAVIDGDEDSFDVTGMFEAGGEVTIRFRLSEQDDDEQYDHDSMEFYRPDGTLDDTVKFIKRSGDDNECYTDEPTHVRIYDVDMGDNEPWHIDGVDAATGQYTEAVERYDSKERALAELPRFVGEFFNPELHS